ncbi:hypothetical protein JZ751_001794 [Albula glossodonta]|uniref:Aminopeptidase n=1 Tax=Albula glossodonta TaxID=121402 RepID=A0A8T2PUT2_9TELE|nr:hypothetical protein JZ751_001794 [Albula glossodonta]
MRRDYLATFSNMEGIAKQHLVRMLRLAMSCLLVSACSGLTIKTNNSESFPWSNMRLPTKVVPNHYDLSIHPNLTTLNFTGTVKISVDVKQDISYIVLHSKGLEITMAKILAEGMEQDMTVLEHLPHEQIALLLPHQLHGQRQYQLYIEYQADLADGFDGFYKSIYRTQNGYKRVLAATDFEPTAARMAFPCFDEPLFKSTFSIKIRRERRHIALSNMPKMQTVEHDDGLVEDIFDKSVKMSTYLVAFVIGDFRSISATTSTGVKISVYAVPEKWSQTHYALEVAVKLLEFFEAYFNISYPLPKQDLIAIPDFQGGAMENWGLITYRETALLYDPQMSSATDKLWITKVIGHELAHQGACVLNMLRDFLSEEVFQSGIIRYLEKYSYSNARSADLWNTIANASSEREFSTGGFCYTSSQAEKRAHQYTCDSLDLREMMDTWTQQMGIPLITVKRTGHNIHIQQERFLKGVLDEDADYTTLQSGTGKLSLDRALNLTHYLKKETDNIPLLQGISYLNVVYRLMERKNNTDTAENLKNYILWYFKDVIDKQTWSDTGSVSERRLRSELLELACDLGYTPCVSRASQIFNEWVASNGTRRYESLI